MQATDPVFPVTLRARNALRAAACGLMFAGAAAWAQVPQSATPAAATPMKPSTAASNAAPLPGTSPDNRTAPLVTVPLGRTATDPASPAASAGGAGDGMARCKALPPGVARDDCVRRARITAQPR